MQQRAPNREKTASGSHHAHSHAGFRRTFLYGPNEVSIVGSSGLDALAESLLGAFGDDYRVAWLKQGPKEGTIDAPGSASSTLGGGYALEGRDTLDPWTATLLWNDADLLLVENDRSDSIAKVVVVDDGATVLDEIDREAAGSVIACTSAGGLPSEVEERIGREGVPYFDEPAGLARFLLAYLEQRARSVPLYGLVIGGGKSTRMQRDKAQIAYRGVAQVRYAYELLAGECDRAFVSIRSDQAKEEVFAGLEQIHDRFSGIGPMGGILSAMHTYPEAAWLVLGCDLPFVDRRTLRELKAGRDPLLQATCYESSREALPEPLCAIYEPRYRRRLHQFLAEGRDCPRKALINTRVKRLTLGEAGALENINSPEDYERAAARIREEAGRAG